MLTKLSLNKFLQSKAEVIECSEAITRAGLKNHPISCKDFDLRNIIPYLGDGNFCDLGAAGSFVLHNHVLLNLQGRRVGIDLVPVAEHDRTSGVEYFVGSLMETPFPDGEFKYVTSISVLEHSVSYEKFAKETSRILQKGGELFVSFDYAEPMVDTSKTKLFDLDWTILCRANVEELVRLCKENGLELTSEIDWTTNEWVINPSYCSPADVSYSFGLLHFLKK